MGLLMPFGRKLVVAYRFIFVDEYSTQVRKAIEAMQAPMPEDLPAASSIRKMVEERRRKKKKGLHGG